MRRRGKTGLSRDTDAFPATPLFLDVIIYESRGSSRPVSIGHRESPCPRVYAGVRVENHLRVSDGTREQMRALKERERGGGESQLVARNGRSNQHRLLTIMDLGL